jgi:LysR family transcriptional regulator, transcriptional activator for dmlA
VGERPARVGPSHVSPVCCDLVRAYPRISVDLILIDRFVELIDERMDAVVRIGIPGDSDLVMRKLERFPAGLNRVPNALKM